MNTGIPSKKFFVSHQNHDTEFALQIAKWLEQMGHQTSIDVLDFKAGENFLLKMLTCLQQADSVICVISKHFLESQYCMLELLTALNRNPLGNPPNLFLVLAEDCVLPDMLKMTICIDLRNLKGNEAFEVFKTEISTSLTGQRRSQITDVIPKDYWSNKAKILFASFRQIEGTKRNPGERWPYLLEHELETLVRNQPVGFVEIPEIVTSQNEALHLLKKHKATVIIWGTIADDSAEINYTAADIKLVGLLTGKTYISTKTSHNRFEAYITNGGDTEYILNVILGLLKASLGSYEEAVIFFSQALKLIPKGFPQLATSSLLINRAFCLALLNREKAALRDLCRIILVDPENSLAYEMRGRVNLLSNNHFAAIADCNHAINIDPTMREAYIHRAVANYMLGNNEASLADLNEAIDLESKDKSSLPTAYLNRGLVYKALGKYQESIADLTKAIGLNRELITAYEELGMLYGKLENHLEALNLLNKAITMTPDSPKPGLYVSRGIVYKNLGRFTKALEDLTRAISLDSKNILALIYLGLVYDQLHQPKKALLMLNQAIKLNPKNAEAYYFRGVVNTKLERYPEAISDYSKAISLTPYNAIFYLARGEAHYHQGNRKNTIQDLEKYMSIVPNPDPEYIAFLKALKAER